MTLNVLSLFAGIGEGSPGGQDEDWSEFAGGSWWAVEPQLGRVAYGVPSRVDRLRVLGNAVVPQVGEFVGRLLRGWM